MIVDNDKDKVTEKLANVMACTGANPLDGRTVRRLNAAVMSPRNEFRSVKGMVGKKNRSRSSDVIKVVLSNAAVE